MNLTIVLATRNRTGLLQKTLARTLPNVYRQDTRFLVMVDEDDVNTVNETLPNGVEKVIIPRPDSVGEKFNIGCKKAPADVYMAMVDYVAYVTPGFDQKILDAAAVFPDGIGVVYNLPANLSFPWLNAVTDRYTELAGGMYPEIFPYWFVDHWLDDIARIIDRISFADVQAKMDFKPPTQVHREPAFWATLYDATTMDRREIAHRIIDAPDFVESDWRKKILKSHHPMIEARSTMLNGMVKQMQAQDKTTDARYERMRNQAVEIMRERLKQLEAA